jgi:formate hydrogenlyase transcriptional activator
VESKRLWRSLVRMTTHADVQRRNERLELLLKVTNKITSNLDLREVIRSITGNLLEFTKGDLISLSLPDAPSGKFRVYAFDFPQGKGMVKEGQLVTPAGPVKHAFNNLEPVIIDTTNPSDFSPELQPELALVQGTKSICIIPLVNHGRALGILGIGRTVEILFTDEEVEFLTQIAGPM